MQNLKYLNVNVTNLFIALIIPFLILGPFLPDLTVSISALLFLYYVIKNNNFYYFNHKSFIIFLLFCILCIVSSLRSENILFSLKSSLFYFRIGVFSCLVWYLIDKDKSILNYFYYILILCFSALAIDGYYQYFNEENIFGFKISGIRISSFFGDELVMGSYLSRMFPLLFALFLYREKKKFFEIYFIGFLFIVVDILIFISAERTAFFFLNLSAVFVIILMKENQKFRLVTFIISIFCVTILTLNSPNYTKRMITYPAASIKSFIDIPNSDDSLRKTKRKPIIFTPEHDSHIRTAFNMYLDKPILGHGPKMFRLKCSDPKYATGKKPCTTHPHNFYVQLLAETGIVGFSFLMIAFGYVLYCVYRQFKSIVLKQKRYLTDYQICLLSSILISVWPFSPNGNFFNNWLAIVYSLSVGFYLHSIYSNKKNSYNKFSKLK